MYIYLSHFHLSNFHNLVFLSQPLKVTRRNGEDFVVISAEDWEQEQETLFICYILQNQSLMQQIAESQSTHKLSQGYKPSHWVTVNW